MKILKLAAVAIIALAPLGVAAQQTDEKITLQALLRSGFNIVAMQYLAQSMVFTLQRHTAAYVCDLTLNGETKICVQLK